MKRNRDTVFAWFGETFVLKFLDEERGQADVGAVAHSGLGEFGEVICLGKGIECAVCKHFDNDIGELIRRFFVNPVFRFEYAESTAFSKGCGEDGIFKSVATMHIVGQQRGDIVRKTIAVT